MAKGLSLEELRKNLESDATKRNAVQAATIKQQTARIDELQGLLNEKSTNVYALQNRCYVLSKGILCWACNMQSKCDAYHGIVH